MISYVGVYEQTIRGAVLEWNFNQRRGGKIELFKYIWARLKYAQQSYTADKPYRKIPRLNILAIKAN